MLARILEGDRLAVSTDSHEALAAIRAGKQVWIELERRTKEVDELLEALAIHALTLEHVWGRGTQPKIDDFPEYLYVVVHGIGAAERNKLELVEIDLLIGKNWLITYDRAGLVSDDVGTELDHSARLLAKGVAWLAHGILDHVVDHYLPIIDELDGELDQLERDVIEKAGTPRGRGVMQRILGFKRMLQSLRRMSVHQREILLKLSRGEYDEIPPEALPFYRDVYDHFLRIQDLSEGYRDLVTSCLDAYLSVQSNRMNEVMKTLTLMSTLMLPLTFIAGVYGMNFSVMPETKWQWGYLFALVLMGVVAISILLWFRRKGWIGGRPELDGVAKRGSPPSDAESSSSAIEKAN